MAQTVNRVFQTSTETPRLCLGDDDFRDIGDGKDLGPAATGNDAHFPSGLVDAGDLPDMYVGSVLEAQGPHVPLNEDLYDLVERKASGGFLRAHSTSVLRWLCTVTLLRLDALAQVIYIITINTNFCQ